LTVIEDIEKENKIKNFKNMLITFVFLKQFKKSYKVKIRNMKVCRTSNKIFNDYYNYRLLNAPFFHLERNNSNFSGRKGEPNIHFNLPVVQKPLSREAANKEYVAKSTKIINGFRYIKPNNLFIIDEKNSQMKKLKSNISPVKIKEKKKNQKDKNGKRNVRNNLGILKESNSLFQLCPDLERKNKLRKLEEKGRNLRLLSSSNLNNDNAILKNILIHSPRNGSNLMTNKKIIKYFLHKMNGII
jgi:hypothetical protein